MNMAVLGQTDEPGARESARTGDFGLPKSGIWAQDLWRGPRTLRHIFYYITEALVGSAVLSLRTWYGSKPLMGRSAPSLLVWLQGARCCYRLCCTVDSLTKLVGAVLAHDMLGAVT